MSAKIIYLPGANRPPVVQRHVLSTRPPMGRRRQRVLALEPGQSSFDQRINHAKATAANYEDMAAQAATRLEELRLLPGRERDSRRERELSACYGDLAKKWNAKVLEIIAERDHATAQQTLLPETER